MLFLLLQADEAAEALDAAAVEAALSLCEENSHTLSGSWDAGPFQPHEPHPTVPTAAPQSSSLHISLEERTEASLSSLCSSQDNCIAKFPMDLRSPPPTASSLCNSKCLENCHSVAPPQSEALRETGEIMRPKKQILLNATIKCESEKQAQQRQTHTGMHIHF